MYKANFWLQRAHLPKFRLQYAEERRRNAELAFCVLRSRAEQVVPGLIVIYREAAGPYYWAYQYNALNGLSLLGPWAKDAVPFLLGEAGNTNTLLRAGVLRTLGMIHADAERVVPVLAMALQDDDLNVRASAAQALGEFGPSAQEAIPILRSFLNAEKEALKSSPNSLEHRMAKGVGEAALDSITQTSVVVGSRQG
jgi:hypothetical protein